MEKALKISDLLEGKARVPQGAPESPQKGGWVSVVDSERAQAGSEQVGKARQVLLLPRGRKDWYVVLDVDRSVIAG